jgi:hypothetical protein
VREQARDLVGARDARARDAMRRAARRSRGRRTRCCPRRRGNAPNHVDQRRLARAVGAEHAEDLAFADFEVDAVERAHAGERLAHAAHDQKRLRRLAMDDGSTARAAALRDSRPSRGWAGDARTFPGSVGHEEHRADEDRADDRLAGHRLVGSGRRVEQDRDHRRAERGTGPVPRAAQHAHQMTVSGTVMLKTPVR